MTLQDLSNLSQTVGAVAILASLAAVYWQVRQTNAIARAQISQSVAAELNTLKWSVTNPGFRAWWGVNPISLSAEFRAFIDGLIRDANETSMDRQ